MSPDQFKELWSSERNNLSALEQSSLIQFNLKPDTIEFLNKVGLPNEAAPFLSFVKNSEDPYYKINKLTKQYDFLDEAFDQYVLIGSCGDGDPIAIDTNNNDRIVSLYHEDDFSICYFNSSINVLAECILIYRDFVHTVIKENGEDAILDANFSDQQFETLQNKLFAADDLALSENSFWKISLDMLLSMRSANRTRML